MSKQHPKPHVAISEFLSEAQEIIEHLSNNLMQIDGDLKQRNEADAALINETFRNWHTLKGLASTFGAEALATLAHVEENRLDDIRMGRVALTPDILDHLFGSVDTVMQALVAINTAQDFGAAQHLLAPTPLAQGAAAEPSDALEALLPRTLIPGDIAEVLTEYEEHRLTANIEAGRAILKIHASFYIASLSTDLEAITAALKPVGEHITSLPSDEASHPDQMDIELLLALGRSRAELAEALTDYDVRIDTLIPENAWAMFATAVDATPLSEAGMSQLPAPSATASAASNAELDAVPAPTDNRQPPAAPAALRAPTDNGEKLMSLRSVSQTVRVDISKLDRLMNSVGELGLVRTAISRVSDELRVVAGRRDLAIELHRIVRGFERRLADIREGILEVRMVPVGQMFDRLSQIIRKESRKLGKEVQFVVSGAETEVDKLIIEELSDPLMHIIRNAIDHGIEFAADRQLTGKPEAGTIALTAYQKGNHVLIEVEDDGSGIDTERILEAAIAAGNLLPEQADALNERERLNLIFTPGITTSSELSVISGRGVGMDVVKTNISALGGIVEVQSEIGIGTKFTITMPVTLAITPALLVKVRDNIYAIPLNTVAEAMTLKPEDVRQIMNTETMTLRGQTLPLCRLDTYLNIPRDGAIPPGSRVIVAALGQRRLGLVVDALAGQQDVVIKPMGDSISRSGCFSGVTDIGNQQLALVLDTAAAIEEFFMSNDDLKPMMMGRPT